MAESARVTSVDALRGFIPAVVDFREAVQASLMTADASANRVLDWLHKDRLPHWKRQVQKRQELVTRAKSTLESKRPLDADQPRSNVEAEIALRKAQHALQEAQSKLAQTQQWSRVLARSAEEYRGLVSPLGWFASADLARAVSTLDAMGAALEAYLAAGGAPDAPGAPTLDQAEPPDTHESEGAP